MVESPNWRPEECERFRATGGLGREPPRPQPQVVTTAGCTHLGAVSTRTFVTQVKVRFCSAECALSQRGRSRRDSELSSGEWQGTVLRRSFCHVHVHTGLPQCEISWLIISMDSRTYTGTLWRFLRNESPGKAQHGQADSAPAPAAGLYSATCIGRAGFWLSEPAVG